MTTAAPLISESTYWYLSRASGFVSLVLFTTSVALGLLTAGRVASPAWPRFVTEGLHRNVALTTVSFVIVHAITITFDKYVGISVFAAVVPFISEFLPLWVGFGAIAFDVLLTLVITSLLRTRLSHRAWRLMHWLSYLGWPLALAHTIGVGTDRVWVIAVVTVSLAAVLTAGGVRLAGWRRVSVGRPV
ncbi:MAG TPA: ferric reductase-like transmembrane domain-containing protein [Pseudonocardiaceae bacterium]|jgi:predicted ferric reductase